MSAPADTLAWDRVVADSYGLVPHAVAQGGSRLRLFHTPGGRTISNAPYLEYGGITLAAHDSLEELQSRLHAHRDNSGARTLLIKSRAALFTETPRLMLDQRYVTFELDLQFGAESIWRESLAAKTRNQIRKARRHAFGVRHGSGELLDDFYQVIARCWRDLGTPVHSRAFFAAIVREFGTDCRIITIDLGGTPVAAALVLDVDGTVHHPFAGTVNRYKPTSVNNLLVWHIIESACERGATTFDMGRSALGSGTYRYKASWGARPVPLYYHYFLAPGARPPARDSVLMKTLTGLWRHMPLGVAKKLGQRLIRYVL